MASRKLQRRKRFLMLVALIIIVWTVVAFSRGYYRNYQAQQRLVELESEIKAYEIRNEQLQAQIDRLQSPEYVERVAREELGLVRPGERLYIIEEVSGSD